LVTRVLPSYFSNVQKDEAALRAYVLNITEALLLVTLPASLGLSLLAPELVSVVLGPRWANSVLPLRILALYIAFRSITTLFAPLLNVRGESRFAMWNNVAAALYFPAAFYVGSRFGIVGIALVWPLLYPLVALPLYFRVFKQINLSWRVYLASIYPALSGSLLMTAYLIAIRNVLPTSMRPYLRLSVEILTGAAVYCLAMITLHRARVRQMFILLKSATHGRSNVQGGVIAAPHVPECQPIRNEERSGLR
jgi:O-antigen/teichoic acid export membrane protein